MVVGDFTFCVCSNSISPSTCMQLMYNRVKTDAAGAVEALFIKFSISVGLHKDRNRYYLYNRCFNFDYNRWDV